MTKYDSLNQLQQHGVDSVPSCWKVSKVKYLADYVNGYAFKPDDWSLKGKPIIRIQNLTNQNADANKFDGQLSKTYLVQSGDILISWSASLGVYQWKGEDAWLNQHIFKVNLSEVTHKKYFIWLADWFMYELNRNSHGSTMQHLTKDAFGSFPVLIPPLEEQRAIAEMLDRETRRLDELITEKERIIELLGEKRRALITKTVTRGLDTNAALVDSGVEWLGEIPQHWHTVRIKFLVSKIGSGKTPSGGAESYVSQGVAFIRSQNVLFQGLSLQDVVFIDEETDKEMKNSRVNSGDVLLNITGASIGRCCVVPNSVNRANVNQHVCIVRPIPRLVDKNYLNSFLGSVVGQFQIFAGEVGVSREGITFEDIANFVVSLPPFEEQQEIVEYIEAEIGKIDRLQAATLETVELLKERRSALIAAAVTGKISVTEI